mgnify:CR=1 FL=1
MFSKSMSLCLFGLFFLMQSVAAQSDDDKQIKNVINTFFEGMHASDTLKIKEVTGDNVILQTIGKSGLKLDDFGKFLRNIASINPETTKIEEKILSFNIKIDGKMANAWTPYEFYVNAKFSHCGVNSFQLFHDNGTWKIIYLIDTRRRASCEAYAE